MKKFYLSALFLMLTTVALLAQTRPGHDAVRLSAAPNLDGELTDSCWQQLAPLEAFSTSTPVFGQVPGARTEVRLFYTETVLFIGAYCYDPDAAGVRRDGAARDGELTGDWFQVSLDTWNDDQLAFDFTVSAAGDQLDARQGDTQWNARWASAVRHTADGWALEMAIPFSALRYAPRAEHAWGLQLTRFDRSTGETSTWSPQDPLVQDRVLQFGTLTGLRDIRQTARHLLAVHSSSRLDMDNEGFAQSIFRQSLGVDGRLGINESTTLDFTLLPPAGYYTLFKESPFLGKKSDFYWNAGVPPPRQLMAEESGLFQRNASLWYDPVLSFSDLSWRFDSLGPLDFPFSGESALLNVLKLNTRTRGALRLGVYNALLGPVDAAVRDFSSSSSFSERTERLLGISNYNCLDAEYVLPNTGYVNLSSATYLASSDLYGWLPALSFRLRTPDNSHEAAGSLRVSHLRTDTITRTGQSYWLSLGRVNRRWGWNVSHAGQTKQYQFKPVVTTRAIGASYAITQGQVTYRDYKPHGKFVNRYGALGLRTRWAAEPTDQTTLNIFANLSGLDRRFRRHTIEITALPHTQRVRYGSSGAYLSQKLAPRLGGSLSLTTDLRRRLVWTGQVGGSTSLRGEASEFVAQTEGSWVLGPHFTLRLSGRKIGHLDQLFLLNTPGEWIFERRDTWVGQDHLGIDWFAAKRFRVFLEFGVTTERYRNRETVAFQPDGNLTPVSRELPVLFSSTDWSGVLGVQYFFNDISQVRLSHTYRDLNYDLLAPAAVSYSIPNQTELQFIYIIGGGRYR